MAISAGRDFLIKKNSVTVAACRAKTLTMNATPIDITNDDSAGIVTLLDGADSSVQLSLSFDGVASETTIKALAFSTTAGSRMLTDITITDPTETSGTDVLTGDWYITKYELTGPYDLEMTFSMEMVSSGAWTRG
jgi:TP901-1 family phage major tail protein